jgi:5-methylthioribose kinase
LTVTALDIEQPEALISYLRKEARIGNFESPQIQILAGGVSNRTVLVQRPDGESWVLKQALPKLRVQVDWFSDPKRIHREALGLRWLERLAPPGTTTTLVFEDHQHHLLGMTAVPEPHENWKTVLLEGRLETSRVERFGELLATIHRRGWERRAELADVFAEQDFFESLRLEPYYAYTAEHVPEAAQFLRSLVEETRARRDTLVHGDYSPKNVLVGRDAFVLLDHEVIHFGEPAFDLGFSLTHLLSKAHHLRTLRSAFAGAAADYWDSYRDTLGHVSWANDLEPRAVRHTLACLLARVAGRSPLEYLDQEERARQHCAAAALMRQPPRRVSDLIERFVAAL